MVLIVAPVLAVVLRRVYRTVFLCPPAGAAGHAPLAIHCRPGVAEVHRRSALSYAEARVRRSLVLLQGVEALSLCGHHGVPT